MSVGHVARAIEAVGIATVTVLVRAFRHIADNMQIPRVVVTRHPMGRPLGAPGDRDRQRQVILAALRLLAEPRAGISIVELPETYRVPTI